MKEQEIRRILANKLHEFRKRAGLSAKDVGMKIGKSDKTVSGWEHGRGQPDADTLFLLCDIYGISSIAEFYSDSTANMPSLREDEESLLFMYRMLNDSGKTTLLGVLRGLTGNPDMLA